MDREREGEIEKERAIERGGEGVGEDVGGAGGLLEHACAVVFGRAAMPRGQIKE